LFLVRFGAIALGAAADALVFFRVVVFFVLSAIRKSSSWVWAASRSLLSVCRIDTGSIQFNGDSRCENARFLRCPQQAVKPSRSSELAIFFKHTRLSIAHKAHSSSPNPSCKSPVVINVS
jgi:hypothetical protein